MGLAWLTSEIAWLIAAWFCALVAIGLIVYALFGDRARGRKRCPGCWYDLTAHASGTYPVRCPECGRESKRERDLGRNRVRFGYIGAAMAILAVAYVASVMERTLDRGAIGLAPTPALVLIEPWGVPSTTGGCTITFSPVIDELLEREDDHDFLPVWGRLWAWRTGLEFRSAKPGAPSFVGIDLGPICEVAWGPGWRTAKFPMASRVAMAPSLMDVQQARLAEVAAIVPSMIDAADWTINGGAVATIELRGRMLMLAGPSITLSRATTLLDMCREGRAIARVSDDQYQERYLLSEPREIMVISLWRYFQSSVDDLERATKSFSIGKAMLAHEIEYFAEDVGGEICTRVRPESWVDNGGDSCSWVRFGGCLVISCPRVMAPEIEAELLRMVGQARMIDMYYTGFMPEPWKRTAHPTIQLIAEPQAAEDEAPAVPAPG